MEKAVGLNLPSVASIEIALRKTTETLALEMGSPGPDPPLWTRLEWNVARAVSGMHGLSPILRSKLRWQGPDIWAEFLEDQTRHSLGRHELIVQVLKNIDAQSRLAKIPLVILKGAALHACAVYEPGNRPMGDIDLLVDERFISSTSQILGECGYARAFDTRRHDVFAPLRTEAPQLVKLGEHVDNPIKIEVHTRIAERLPVAETDITDLLWPSNLRPGLNSYRSMAALMLHLLLHAAGNMRARALRMIQLHDIALLASRFDYVDWEELLAMRPNGRSLWWAYGPVLLVDTYYPDKIPINVISDLDASCPRFLARRLGKQKLTDVSWSNIRIEAFPGIEWSQSWRDGFAFALSRIWPTARDSDELKNAAGQIPGEATVPWYGISHGGRILRWLVSNPPRVQTLLSVRAAMDQPPSELTRRAP